MQSISLNQRKYCLNNGDVSAWRGLLALILCILPSACGAPPPRLYPITIRVQDEDMAPLSGAAVKANGEQLGMTSRNGLLQIRLKGAEGDMQSVSIRCPDGYRTVNETRSVTLRSFSDIANGLAAKGPTLNWQCEPAERLAALVVRASGQPNIPVRLHGRELTRTGSDGTAHTLLRLPPGSNLRVALDTTARPELRPQSPERIFQVEDRDTIFTFDQQFIESKRPVHRKAPESKRLVPYRIH
jgi:hypothetical protein